MKHKKYINKKSKIWIMNVYIITIMALVVIFLWAVNTGSLQISGAQLFRGLFIEYDNTVAKIYDLRFPRIIIALLVGAALAVSGVLLQAVLKNPLTDPGIIGISGGASFASIIVTMCVPTLYFYGPVFAFLGGLIAFGIVYCLAWKNGISPIRVVLVGVALSTMFTGCIDMLESMTSSVEVSIAMKTWADVAIVVRYLPAFLCIALFFANKCNLLSLEDKTAKGIGVNVNRLRIVISLVAVVLVAVSTAVVGVVSFVGLIVPHISRMLVGNNHKVLLPYSVLLGAGVFLLADTIGRSVVAPYEISASIIMAIVGGPFFILLLRRSGRYGS